MNLEFEAIILSRYLIKRQPTQQVISLYSHAVKEMELTTTLQENNIWSFVLKHPWSIGLIDAGFATSDPHNNLRKRILTMVAILETQIEYHSFFLPRHRSRMHMITICYVMVKATFKMIAGKIFLWLILRK